MMRRIGVSILGLAMWLALGVAQAVEGLNTLYSPVSVAETVDRLETALTGAGFRVFARVDHAAGARSVDMQLAPTELLIFGRPEAGTLLMQSNRSVGIELPLKYLVWEQDDGKVRIGWNDPAWLAARHDIADRAKPIEGMQAALRRFATEATAP